MMDIYYINLKSIDVTKLLKKLHNVGYCETYLNDFSFCPYLIVHKNFDPLKSDYVYENINLGFLNKLSTEFNLIEDTDIDEFITHSIDIQHEKTNGLF